MLSAVVVLILPCRAYWRCSHLIAGAGRQTTSDFQHDSAGSRLVPKINISADTRISRCTDFYNTGLLPGDLRRRGDPGNEAYQTDRRRATRQLLELLRRPLLLMTGAQVVLSSFCYSTM